MKRRLFVILLAVLAAFSAFAFMACSDNDAQKGGDETLIASFEDYDELTSMRWLNQFGSAELSDEHVTHGNKSLHVSAMGKVGVATKPVMCIETKTDRVKKFDFTDVDKFTLDVYNDNDYEANVYFQYLTAAANQNKTSGEIKATVPAKTAKTVEFNIDRALSAYFLNLDDVLQIRILFDPISETGEAYRSFYIDNLRYHTTSEKFTPANPRKADEIESADRPEYTASWGNILAYVYSPSSLSFNADPAFIKGGEGSFKLTSERTGGAADEMYTIGIACINNPIPDFTQYAALGYWVYNANDIAVDAYLTGNYPMGSLQPGEWTYLEVSSAMLKEAQSGNKEAEDVDSLDNFGPMFSVPSDKNYTFYIDEMYAIKDGLEPVISFGDYKAEYPEKGEVVVPKATVKYADGYSVKVYKPNGDLIGEGIESFTAEEYGFYEVVYTATARRANSDGVKATAEERILIAVGTVPKFKTQPQDVYLTAEDDEYSFVPPESDDGATVTWKAEVLNVYYPSYVPLGTVNEVNTDGYENGVKEGTGPSTVKAYDGTVVRITYKATNGSLYSVATQNVFRYRTALQNPAGGPPTMISEEQLTKTYADMYAQGTVNGDLTVESDMQSILGESTGLRLRNELGNAAGTFTPSSELYLGASNANLRFVVYNNGTRPVTFLTNGNGQPSEDRRILPGGYMVYNAVMFGYEPALQGWRLISQDKHLLPITFTASSDAEVDLYIGRFTVNEGSFVPIINISDIGSVKVAEAIDLDEYITVQGAEQAYSYTVSYSETEDGSYVSETTGDNTSAAFTPNKSGWYNVEYTVTYGNGLQIRESKKFQAISRELTFTNVPKDMFAAEGEYTVTMPDCENATVTWKAELMEVFFAPGGFCSHGNLRTDINSYGYENGVKTGGEGDKVYVFANHAVRITFTATDNVDSHNTKIVYQTVINFTDNKRLTEAYSDFYTAATVEGDLVKLGADEMFGDGGFKLSQLTAQAGTYTANGTFTPADNAKFLGGSNKNVRFVVYNNGTDTVTLSGDRFGGNTVSNIKPQTSAVYNAVAHGYEAALIGWRVVENGNLNSFNFIAKSNAPVDVRIGYFAVNDDSFEPGIVASVQPNYSAGASVDFAELLTVAGGNGFEYAVKCDETQIASGSDKSHSAVALSDAGEYIVVYTVHYTIGTQNLTKTVTRNFTVVAERVKSPQIVLGAHANKIVTGGGTYSIADNLPALVDGSAENLTWDVKGRWARTVTNDGDYGNEINYGKADSVTLHGGGFVYKIVYTLSEPGYVAVTATQYILADGVNASALDTSKLTNETVTGDTGSLTFNENSKYALSDKTIEIAAAQSAGGYTAGGNLINVDIGEHAGGIGFWIYVQSDTCDEITIAVVSSGNFTIKANTWTYVLLDRFRLEEAWSVLKKNDDGTTYSNVTNNLYLRSQATDAYTLYIDGFYVTAA